MYVKIHLWCLYTFAMFTVPERSMSVADLSQPDWGTWLSKLHSEVWWARQKAGSNAKLNLKRNEKGRSDTWQREVVGLFSTRLHESFWQTNFASVNSSTFYLYPLKCLNFFSLFTSAKGLAISIKCNLSQFLLGLTSFSFATWKLSFNWKISCRVLPVRTESLAEWEKVLSLLV